MTNKYPDGYDKNFDLDYRGENDNSDIPEYEAITKNDVIVTISAMIFIAAIVIALLWQFLTTIGGK